MLEPSPVDNTIYGLIGMAIVTIGSILVAYFQYRKPKIDGDVLEILTKENKTLEKDNSMLQIDVARLSEQVKNFSKERESFEAALEEINVVHKEKIAQAVNQYKTKIKGIFQSTTLVLGHVTDYIDNEQHASLLKDLQKNLQNELN